MKPLRVPKTVVREFELSDEHRIVRWEPDFVVIPVTYEGSEAVIAWPDGFDYRGLCVDGGVVCGIYKPLNLH